MKLVDVLVQELPKRGGWPDGADFAVQNYRDGGIKFGKKPIEIAISEKWNNELWQGEWNFSYQHDFIFHQVSTDCREAIISRGDYEAALAASESELDSKELPGIIGRFVPIGNFNCGAMPFNVLTRVASGYMPPAWEGIREGGEGYHAIEKAWRFEPVEWNGEGLPKAGFECEWQDKNTKAWIPVVIAYSSEWVTVVRELTPSKNGDAVECCINNFGEEERLQFRPICSEADKKRDESLCAMRNCVSNFNNTSVIHAIGQVYDAIAAGKIPGIRVE